MKVAACCELGMILLGILYVSELLSDIALDVVVKVVSRLWFNDCEVAVVLFVLSSLFLIVDGVIVYADVIFSIISVVSESKEAFLIPSGFEFVDDVTGNTVIVLAVTGSK